MIVYNGVPLSQGKTIRWKNLEQKFICQLDTFALYGIKIGLMVSS